MHLCLQQHCRRSIQLFLSIGWENVAAKIIEPHKIDGKDNFDDIFTKPVDGTTFKYHAWDLMWKYQSDL